MNIFDALKKDHDELRPLLDQLVAASTNDQRTKELLADIADHLIPHARAEEAVLYNSLRAIDSAKGVVEHGFREHLEAEAMLRTLRGLETIGIEWTALAKKLRSALLHHIEEEEGVIFEMARTALFDEEAAQMGIAFRQLKERAEDQTDMKNMMDMAANMLPKRLGDLMRGGAATT